MILLIRCYFLHMSTFLSCRENILRGCLVDPDGRRSLATDLGAASFLPPDYLRDHQVLLALNKAKVFYLAGFSLSLGEEAVDSFVVAAQNKILVVNLSAPFICRKFTNELLRVVRQANLVIGNRKELAALYSSMEERDIVGDEVKETRALKEDKGLEDKDLEDICKKIAKALFSSPLQKLIVTGGMAPILVVSNDNVSYTEVSRVEGVVDTTGAGDALAGGLLAALALDLDLEQGLRWGQEEAADTIKRVGAL